MSNERFLRTEMLLGEEMIERLGKMHVAVFGLGGVGGSAAETLARSGIGKLTLIDDDVVSVSNINRQTVAYTSTLGKRKTEVMAAKCADINPDAEILQIFRRYSPYDREGFFSDYDYIIDAIDSVSCKVDLIENAKLRGIPVISALGAGNRLDPTRFRFADIYDTEGCPLARVVRKGLRKKGIDHLEVLFSDEPAIEPSGETNGAANPNGEGRRSTPGSVPWVPPIAGMMIAGFVVRKLCNIE